MFVNDTTKLTDKEIADWKRHRNSTVKPYGFSKKTKFLVTWSRYFQALVSQAGTWMFTKHFHTSECGIYKAEGGCSIKETGDLVLGNGYCYFDGRGREDQCEKMAELITELVLKFDPMKPRESLCETAATFIGAKMTDVVKAVEAAHCGGPFSGDALGDFFDMWGMRHKLEDPEMDEYRRWVMVEYLKSKTNEEVDQVFADRELGKELEKKLRDRLEGTGHSIFCCSPKRMKDGLKFWINTGRSTQLDGYKTQKEIEDFIKSKEKIIDRMRG